MIRKIDLHIHSSHSDGSLTTQELLDLLEANGAELISFTDHDSVGCYDDIMNGIAKPYKNLIIVPGVEITCSVDGVYRDILGYGIDCTVIKQYFEERYSPVRKLQKQKEYVVAMKNVCQAHGIYFEQSVDATRGVKSEGFSLMHDEICRYQENIEKYPFIQNATDFFWNYTCNPKSSFYTGISEDTLTTREAIELIHDAGGKAIVAHPYHYKMSDEETLSYIKGLVELGVDGVEIKHVSHSNTDVNKLIAISTDLGLLTSGGSDFHGHLKPDVHLLNGKGNVNVEYKDVEQLLNNIRKFV